MLREKMRWLPYSELLEHEYLQAREEGKPVQLSEVRRIAAMPDGEEKERAAMEWMLASERMPLDEGLVQAEPRSYAGILRTLPAEHLADYPVAAGNLTNHLRAAWAGRMTGCLLGIPVEGWPRERIHAFMEDTAQDPCKGYFSSDVGEAMREKHDLYDEDSETPYDRRKKCWINNMTCFPVDDDTNYTVAALRLLERAGANFTAEDAAENLLYGIPMMHMCTAERLAGRNLLNMVWLPECAWHLNPYREWIGAQIRADFFGYIRPGQPAEAARMAFEDASVTHVRNGVYAEMFTAALVSLAPCGMDGLTMVRRALLQIPPQSRLARRLNALCDALERGMRFDQAIQSIHGRYDEKEFFWWGHAIPNALIVSAVVAFFAEDHAQAIGHAVLCGFDTDCNAATVGSIVGYRTGEVQTHWLERFPPVLQTSVHCYERMTLEELTLRTAALARESGRPRGYVYGQIGE